MEPMETSYPSKEPSVPAPTLQESDSLLDTPKRPKRKELDFKDETDEASKRIRTEGENAPPTLDKKQIREQKRLEKEEANRLRQLEKLRKEEEKKKKEEEKRILQLKREADKRLAQQEREEKKRLREEEKRKKEEEKKLKDEERRKKEEERKAKKESEEAEKKRRQDELNLKKKKKEEEEKAKEEEERRKLELQKKQSAILMNFVQKVDILEEETTENPFKKVGPFEAWVPAKDAIIAPTILEHRKFDVTSFEKNVSDGKDLNREEWMQYFVNNKANAQSIVEERIKKRKEIFKDSIDFDIADKDDIEKQSFHNRLLSIRIKYLKFHNTIRPDFFGSFSGTSTTVTPLNPIGLDDAIDYDIDSDEEWQDINGEDIEESGDEEEMDLLEENEPDDFVVDDDHLSDGEGWNSEDDISDTRVQVPKDTISKKSTVIGPILTFPTEDPQVNDLMSFYSVLKLVEDPLNIINETSDTKVKTKRAKTMPEEMVPELAALIQAELCSSFNVLLEKCVSKFTNVSKKQLSIKINEIASKMKPEGWKKSVWLVNQDMRERLNISLVDPQPPSAVKTENIMEQMMVLENVK